MMTMALPKQGRWLCPIKMLMPPLFPLDKIYEVHLVQIKTGDTSSHIPVGGVGSVPLMRRTPAERNKEKPIQFNKQSVGGRTLPLFPSTTRPSP